MSRVQAQAEAAQLEYAEYEFFYEHALGNFGDLLLFSATSPSMLVYLDNVLNVKRQGQRKLRTRDPGIAHVRGGQPLHAKGHRATRPLLHRLERLQGRLGKKPSHFRIRPWRHRPNAACNSKTPSSSIWGRTGDTSRGPKSRRPTPTAIRPRAGPMSTSTVPPGSRAPPVSAMGTTTTRRCSVTCATTTSRSTCVTTSRSPTRPSSKT